MNIIEYIEEFLGLKLYPYQKLYLKMIGNIKGPLYWTYGKRRSGLINPERLMMRGKRAEMMIYEDSSGQKEKNS